MSKTRFVIIDGSPRTGEPTTSAFLSEIAEKRLAAEGAETQVIVARKSLKGDAQTAFEAMDAADRWIFVFPLYFFCVPGMLLRFMQDYAEYRGKHPSGPAKRIYAIVNCGFPEPEINTEAVRVITSFSRHIGATFGFGINLGGGPMLAGTKDAPFMRPLFAALDEALVRMARGESGEDVMLVPRIPRRLYYIMGNFGWRYMQRKNGLHRKDLYKTPYAAQ